MKKQLNMAILAVAGVITATPAIGDPNSLAKSDTSCGEALRAFQFHCNNRRAITVQKFQDCVIYRMAMLGLKFRDSYRLLDLKDFYCVGKPQSCPEGIELAKRACSIYRARNPRSAFRKCTNIVMRNYGYRQNKHYNILQNKLVCKKAEPHTAPAKGNRSQPARMN